MDDECYGGGSIVKAIFGTIIVIALFALLGWWIYKKYYCKHRKDSKLVENDDPENAKHEFAFDNPAFKGEGAKSTSSPLNTNWTVPQANQTHDKRKPLDDRYAGMPAPRLVSLRGSDFTGLGIECYGGLKDGIYVKKVAAQGPASGHINIGDRITSLTIDFQHIVQEDAMTILSYASPYNVQLELMNGNNKLRASGSSSKASVSPGPGRQSPLVHPLCRSSSQSDRNTIERNSRKQLFLNEDKDYPTLKMDKNMDTNAMTATLPVVHKENEKKSPSLRQQFKDQITKIEEKFQNRSTDKQKAQTTVVVEKQVVEEPMKGEKEGSASPSEPGKKGLKFGIRVFPPTVNEKLFGKARSKSPPSLSPTPEMEKKNEVKINIDEVDLNENKKPQVPERGQFNRQGSVNSSGIKRDANGIPQELPSYLQNAANAAFSGRKLNNDSGSRKSKGKAPTRPSMTNIDLDTSTDTMDTNLSVNMTDFSSTSLNNISANNTNNANMEIEDELDRITEKYLSMSKDKMNFSDNFTNTSQLNKSYDDSITVFDKIEDMKDKIDDIDDVVLREKRPSNTSTPKSERKGDSSKNFMEEMDTSDLDLSNYGTRMELNSSDITVHQANESEDACDETRRAASLGDLSRFEMKKSSSANDNVNSSTLERAQSLDITDNQLLPKHTMPYALTKPTENLSNMSGEKKQLPVIYQMDTKSKAEFANGNHTEDEDVNKTDQTKITSITSTQDTNIPDDIKVIRYPFGSLERPKSDVLKKLMGTPAAQKVEMESQEDMTKSSTTPSIILMTPTTKPPAIPTEQPTSELPTPMTNGNLTSIVTIESQSEVVEQMPMDEFKDKMTILTIDTNEQPVSLTIVNNKMDMDTMDRSQASPIFSSNNFGVNSIKISTAEMKPQSTVDKSISSTIIKNGTDNHFTENFFVKDNVVTISTDSQPTSIQFIDDVKLDFNMQVLDDMEKEDYSKDDFKPKIIEAESKLIHMMKTKASEMINYDDKPKPDQLQIFTEITDEIRKVNGNCIDLEINNNISKTTIMKDIDGDDLMNQQHLNKFLTEIVFKGDDSMNGDMSNSEETATLTSSTMSNDSSSPSSPNVMTSSTTMTLTNVPLSNANFLRQEQRHVEKNFVPHNSDIKFTTAVYENASSPLSNHHHHKEPQKRVSQIEQIRQNFEKSAQASSEIPVPVARRSSIPLSIKTSPSKIPVFNKVSSKTSPPSRHSSNLNINFKLSNDSIG